MDWKQTAKQITECVGGKQNIRGATYCTTRLRLTLADESLADDDAVSQIPGVISVVRSSGQYQIIIGNRVPVVFRALQELGVLDQAAASAPETKKKSIPARMMDALLGSITPVIPAIIGCAMMKVLLVLLPMLGVLQTESMTYQVLTVIGDGSFYFLPILVAVSAAHYFNANLFLSITIAGILIHPSLQAMFSAGEPVSLFGIPVLAASFASGCFAGLMQFKSFSTACPGLVTTIQYIEADRPISILYIALTCLIAVAVSFVLMMILGFRDPESKTAPAEKMGTAASAAKPAPAMTRRTVDSPMDGKLVPLSEVSDETFASGVLGTGAAIVPADGIVYAPFDGTVETLMDSNHAVGLRSTDGIELLIHIGRDTVSLGGQYFTAHVKLGDNVKKGQKLLSCDLDGLRAAGYEVTTPVIVTNSDEYLEVVPVQQPEIKHGAQLLTTL